VKRETVTFSKFSFGESPDLSKGQPGSRYVRIHLARVLRELPYEISNSLRMAIDSRVSGTPKSQSRAKRAPAISARERVHRHFSILARLMDLVVHLARHSTRGDGAVTFVNAHPCCCYRATRKAF
jgi:hypothetical protein